MPQRGHATLAITFGPASTPVFEAAVAYARGHADQFIQTGPRTHRASFVLGTDPVVYGRALHLVHMVSGWRSTLMEVHGSPEYGGTVRAMLHCAREWLRRTGRCAERFPGGPCPKYRGCPLYDSEWAPECFTWPTWTIGLEPLDILVPDYVPEDWT
ncbi:MAG TPA: hypothetical protein VF964_02660 [Vicinamibacteria bacterium]